MLAALSHDQTAPNVGVEPDGVNFGVEEAYKYQRRRKLLEDLADLKLKPKKVGSTKKRQDQSQKGFKPIDDTAVSAEAPDFFHIPGIKMVRRTQQKMNKLAEPNHFSLQSSSPAEKKHAWGSAATTNEHTSKRPAPRRPRGSRKQTHERRRQKTTRENIGGRKSLTKRWREPPPFLVDRLF